MNPTPKNLKIFSEQDKYLSILKEFGIIEEGHFEYKGKIEDGRHMRGEYFINFRRLMGAHEQKLIPLYKEAILEFFGDKIDTLAIVGVAMGSLSLPKAIQTILFDELKIEYIYTEKREGVLGIYGEQADKCKGKHLLFIEDICNNGTSTRELLGEIENKKESLQIEGFSMLYGVHRGHTFFDTPEGAFYAMSMLYAPAYHPDEVPAHVATRPLKEYKK